MGRMSRFLRVFAFIFGLIFAGNAFAAGYVCEDLRTYTSCAVGYYMTSSPTSSTYNGTPVAGNACKPCNGTYCPGGTDSPLYKITLSANGGTAGSVTAIYVSKSDGAVYTGTTSTSKGIQITTLAGSLPSRASTTSTSGYIKTTTSYLFGGYYNTSASSGGTSYVGANGTLKQKITALTTMTLYARWSVLTTTTISCPAGMYSDGTTCQVCGAGTYSNGGAITSCTTCPGSHYTNTGSAATDHAYARSCKAHCPSGLAVLVPGATCQPLSNAYAGVFFTNPGEYVAYGDVTSLSYCPLPYANGTNRFEQGAACMAVNAAGGKVVSANPPVQLVRVRNLNTSTASTAGLPIVEVIPRVGTAPMTATFVSDLSSGTVLKYPLMTDGKYTESDFAVTTNGISSAGSFGTIIGGGSAVFVINEGLVPITAIDVVFFGSESFSNLSYAIDISQTGQDDSWTTIFDSTATASGAAMGSAITPSNLGYYGLITRRFIPYGEVPVSAGNYAPARTIYLAEGDSSLSSTACPIGSYTNAAGQDACTPCQNGTTTSGTGKTSCDANCGKSNVASWLTASWSSGAVTNVCKIDSCNSGYVNASNTCSACAWTAGANSTIGAASTNDTNQCQYTTTCSTGYSQSGGSNTTTSFTTTGTAGTASGTLAGCVANTITVAYNGNGNTGGAAPTSPTSCTYAGTCNAPANTYIKTGKEFTGWNTKADGTGTSYAAGASISKAVASGTLTLYAQWKDCTAGKYCPSDKVGAQSCPAGTSVAGSDEATDCYFTVTLNKNGGSGTCGGASGTTNGSVTCYYNKACTLPSWNSSTCNITNGSKTFQGWSESSSATAGSYSMTFTAAKTVNAAWAPTQCFVNNGTGVAVDTTTNAPKCTVTCNSGYKTSGTYTGTVGSNSYSYTCSGNTITVDYNENSGSSVTNGSCTYGSSLTLPAAPTRTGYTFSGWKLADGTVKSASTSVTCNYTNLGVYSDTSSAVTAQWSANTYTVSFDANGGTGGQSANVTATYGSNMPSISTTAPTKAACRFNGWYDATSGGTQYYTSAGASARTWNKTANTTLYAQWSCFTASASNKSLIYNGSSTTNGSAQSCAVTPTVNGITDPKVTYSESASGTFSGTAPTLTNVGTKMVYYRVAKSGYTTYQGSYTCTMGNKAMTVSASNVSKVYTGSAQSCANVSVSVPSDGKIQYKTSSSASYSDTVPTLTNVGSTTVYYQVTGSNFTTNTGQYTCSITKATMSASLAGNSKTYNGSALTCDGGTQSGVPSGSEITYSTTNGSGYSSTKPTRTDAGTTTVYYKITNANYNDFTSSFSCKVNKANNPLSISTTSGSTTYPNTTSFTFSGAQGTVTATSANTNAATVAISGTTVTITPKKGDNSTVKITVKADGNSNYNAGTKEYTVTLKPGTISATVNNNSQTYNGSALTCDGDITGLTPSGATVQYATQSGGTCGSYGSAPTRTAAGTTTVCYKISATNYTDKTGTFTCTVGKATMSASLAGNSKTYNGSALTCDGGTQSGVPSGSEITYSTTNGSGYSSTKPTRTDAGTTTVYYKITNANYNDFTSSFSCKVNKANNPLSISTTSGSTTYPNTTSFTFSGAQGTVTATSANTNAATVAISGTTVTITPKKGDNSTVKITVKADGNSNYNAGTKEYTVTLKPGTISATVNNNSQTYNGSALTCDGDITGLTPSGATVQYATKSNGSCGTYGSAPSRTDYGTTTVCYKITATNYTTKTGEFTCSVSKANNPMSLSATSGSVAYPNSTTFTVNNSKGTLSVATSNSAVATATISGTTVTVKSVKPGTATITVYDKDATNYSNAEKTYSVTVSKGTNPIALSTSTGSTTYPSTKTVTVSGAQGTVTATSGTESVATVSVSSDGKTVTMTPVKAGSATITVTAAGNDYYNAGNKTYTLTVNRGTCTISVNPTSGTITYPTTTSTFTVTKGNCNGSLSVTSSNSDVATASISGTTGTVTWKSAGTAKITVTAAQSDQYNKATADYSVTTKKGTNTLTLSATSGSVNYNSTGTFTVSKNTSGGSLSVSSSNSTVATATISGTTVTITGKQAGTATITVTSAATAGYNSQTATYNVTVNKINGTTTVSKTSVEITYPTTTGSFTASCSESATPSVSSSDASKASVAISSGTATVTWKAAGSATVTVSCPETTNYNASSKTVSVTTKKGTNTLTLSATSGSVNYNSTGTFTVSKNTSGGSLSVSSSNSTVATATISGTTVTITGKQAGTATITVTSAATSGYNSQTATYNVTVNKIAGTTTLGATSGTLTYPTTSGSFTVSCSESATPTVSLDTSTYASATVGSGKVSTTWKAADGTTKITVSCPATTNYNASSATYTLYTKKAANPISLSAASGSINYNGTGTFTVSGAQGTVTATSGNTTVATVSVSSDGKTVTMTGKQAGSATITVNAAGNANYYGGSKTYTVTVNKIAGTTTVSKTSVEITYPTTTGSFTASCSESATPSVSSSDASKASVAISSGTATVTWKAAGSATVTVSCPETTNYNASSKTVSVTTKKGTNTLTLSATSGNMAYSATKTFTVSKNTSGGSLSVTSSNSDVATATISGTTVTITSKTGYGTANITVTSAETANYNAASAKYTITVDLGKITLNNQSATTAGTTAIYQKYNTNVWLDSARNNAMTTSANGITIPKKSGLTFNGYYSATSGGTQYIDANGKITSNGLTAGKALKADGTWYAQWSSCPAGSVCNGSTVTTCPAGSYCPVGSSEATPCAAGTYSTGGAASCTNVTAGCYADTTGSTKSCPKSCSSLGGGLYKNSAAGSDAETDCYFTTTAGKYIASADATAETLCEEKYYCPATILSYPNTGSKQSCPDPTLSEYKEKMTDMDWLTERCPDANASNSSISTANWQSWSNTGLSAITQCPASYTVQTPCATFTIGSATYNSSTSAYDTDKGGIYADNVKAGYYLIERYSDTYCDGKTENDWQKMIYDKAARCPENSFCPGGSVPKCYTGTYNETWGATSCSSLNAGYNYSTGGTSATSSAACYLTLGTGKFVETANADQKTCTAGGYCDKAGTKIYYGSTGGRTPCGAGKYNDATGSSASSACKSITAGCYGTSATTACPNECAKNYYSASGAASCNACTTLGSFYTTTASKKSVASSCYGTTTAGKYIKTANSSTQEVCPAGSYCPATTVYYGKSDTTGGRTACVAPYASSATSSDDANDCYLTTSATKYVKTAGAGETSCLAGDYCPGGATIYKGGSVSGRSTTGGNTQCPAGQFCLAGVSAGTKCVIGSYSSGTGNSACTPCQNGMTTSAAGATSCNATCTNNNSYDNTWKSATWTSSTNAMTNLCTINNCKAGSKYASANGGSCTACATGTYMDSTEHTTTSCKSADAGYYVATTGANAQTQCDNWTFSTGGVASCTSCPTLDSGWSKVDSTSKGWTSYTSCKQTQKPANCASGGITQTATSATAWGASSVTTALTANANYYVNGTACSACSGLGGGLYKTSAAGNSGGASACKATVTAGSYLAAATDKSLTTCTAGYYCPGTTLAYSSTGGRTQCPSGYDDGTTGYSAESQCLMNVAGGKYVATAKESSASGTCAQGYAKAQHTVNYGSTSSCDACTGATYADATGQTSCSACPTATNNVSNVAGYSYWNGGTEGDHTVSNGCYVSFKSTTLDHGATTSYSCYLDKDTNTYGVDGTSKGCWINRESLTCDGGYYNEKFNNSSSTTQMMESTLSDLLAKACTPVESGYWSPADVLTRNACPSGYVNGSATASAESQCAITVSGGKYIGTAGDNSSNWDTCANWTYKPQHTVNYGQTSSCSACPTVPGAVDGVAWTKKSGTGWDNWNDCVVTQTPAHCASGTVQKTASSASAWGETKLASTLKSSDGYYASTSAIKCSAAQAGYFATAGATDQTACVQGAYTSTTAQSACIACGSEESKYTTTNDEGEEVEVGTWGLTTTGAGQTSCNATCSNATGAKGWVTSTWNSDNTVDNLCIISSCKGNSKGGAGDGFYFDSENNACELCSSLAGGLFPHSSTSGTTKGTEACFLYTTDIPGYYIDITEDGEVLKKACPKATYSVGKKDQVVHYGTEKSSCAKCEGNTYQDEEGATECKACPAGYTEYWGGDDYDGDGKGADGRIDIKSCRISCPAGTYIANVGDSECTPVGPGYWAAATGKPYIAYGTTSERGQCPSGQTTIGYGAGANEAGDCGRVLHIGDGQLYLRSEQKTTPSLRVKVGDTTFYGNMTSTEDKYMSHGVEKALKVNYSNAEYSVYDDSGESYIGGDSVSISLDPTVKATSTVPASYNAGDGLDWSAVVSGVELSGIGRCDSNAPSSTTMGTIADADFTPSGTGGAACWCKMTSPNQTSKWILGTANIGNDAAKCASKCGYYCTAGFTGTKATTHVNFRTNMYNLSGISTQ